MPTTSPSSPTLRHARAIPAGADLLVVGRRGGVLAGVDADVAKAFKRAMKRTVDEVATSVGAGDDLGSTNWLPAVGDVPTILVVGLGTGSGEEVPTEDLRSAAGSVARAVAGRARPTPDKQLTVAVSLGLDGAPELRAAAEGLLLGSYSYRPVPGTSPTSPCSARSPRAPRLRSTRPGRSPTRCSPPASGSTCRRTCSTPSRSPTT